MARIRTVKPELWTDPEFTECTMSARLLFIASLNFASDYGVLADKPRQLKMQCMPAESIDADPLIEELIEHGFYVRTVAPNGDKVLVIRTFVQHQKINRASLGRWGDPSKWTDPTPPDSPPPHGDLREDTQQLTESHPPEGKGSGRDNPEGKGSSSSSENNSRLALVPPVDDDDFDRTIRLVVEARCKGRRMDDPTAYARTVTAEAVKLDGKLIRRMLRDGYCPEQIALFVLGHGLGTEAIRAREPVPWCGPDCPTCDGTAWIDTGAGLAPCPERTAAIA